MEPNKSVNLTALKEFFFKFRVDSDIIRIVDCYVTLPLISVVQVTVVRAGVNMQ